MVVQGTDEKWMSCREWAPAEWLFMYVLEFSVVAVYTLLLVQVHTVHVYQYWNSLPEWMCTGNKLPQRARTLNVLYSPPADLTTLSLQLGTTSRTW